MANLETLFSHKNMLKIIKNKFNTENVEVLNTEVNPPPKGTIAMLSYLHKIKIKASVNDNTIDINIIAKTPSDDVQSEITQMQAAFEREIFMYEIFYKEVQKIPNLNFKLIPECYYAEGNYFLALEDLNVRGYKNIMGTIMLDLKHLTRALSTVAKFHAASIVLEKHKYRELNVQFYLSSAYLDTFCEPLYRPDDSYFGYDWVYNSLSTLKDLYSFTYDTVSPIPEINTHLDETVLRIFEIMKPSTKFRNVVCHGDLWSPNILFAHKNGHPVDCKLIDFQNLRYKPPSFDVLNFIYSATTFDFRQKHKKFLLDHYYRQLTSELYKSGININEEITLQEFHETCEYFMPQVLFQSASFANIDLLLLEPDILRDQA